MTLDGKRIMVTRAANQAASMCRLLEEKNARAVVYPTVQIVPYENNTRLQNALGTWTSFDWVIFTSVNGVHVVFAEAKQHEFVLTRVDAKPQVAAIGPATARALEELGVVVKVIPGEFVAEQMVEALGDVSGQHILLPRARKARAVLPERLRDRGAVVTEIATYDTVDPTPTAADDAKLERPLDAITFTSSSTVEGFLRLAGVRARSVLEDTCVACIGPITAETARRHGVRVDVVAVDYTTGGLVEALTDYFDGH